MSDDSTHMHTPVRMQADTEHAMLALGAAFASVLEASAVIALEGELGAGKTVFVRGMARGLGIDPTLVSSPTFVIMQRYGGGRLELLHADAYRLRSSAELESLGWSDALQEPGTIAVMEWASRVTESIPADAIHIALAHGSDRSPQGRTVIIRDPNPARAQRFEDVVR